MNVATTILKVSKIVCKQRIKIKWNLPQTASAFVSTANVESPSSILLSNKVGKFRVLCTDTKGRRTNYEISKSTLYQELGLTVRDLRFQHPMMLSVRNKKIILRLQQLKAVISSDAVLIIDPPSKPLDGTNADNNEVIEFCDSLPTLLAGSALYTSNLPIEYKALEAVFTHALCNFSLSLAKLEPEINDLLSTLTDPTNSVVDRSLIHVLLKSSARLTTFLTDVNEFCEALEEVLDCEEDLRRLCISTDVDGDDSPPMDQSDEISSSREFTLKFPQSISHQYKINLQDEMETVLDSFLKDAEEIQNKARELKEAIETSNTAILINLDSHRNLLLRFELELTIGMFSCTLFGLIGMAFGMNLESSLEENTIAFWCVSGVMVLGAGIVWRYLLHILRRKPLLGTSAFLKSISPDNGSGRPPIDIPPTSHNSKTSQKHSFNVSGASDILHNHHRNSASRTLHCQMGAVEKTWNHNKVFNQGVLRTLPPKRKFLCSNKNRMRPLTPTKGVADVLEHIHKHNYCTVGS